MLPMSPMCWLIQASRPAARQNVFLSSPPTARAGGDSDGQSDRQRRVAARAADRAARSPSTTRTTESSHGTWIGRSWTSHASAMRPSRCRASASSKQIGSSVRLPLVITSDFGHRRRPAPSAPARTTDGATACTAASRRSNGLPGATSADNGESASAPRRARSAGRATSSSCASASSIVGELPCDREIADHHRERLVDPPFALAQPSDRLVGDRRRTRGGSRRGP